MAARALRQRACQDEQKSSRLPVELDSGMDILPAAQQAVGAQSGFAGSGGSSLNSLLNAILEQGASLMSALRSPSLKEFVEDFCVRTAPQALAVRSVLTRDLDRKAPWCARRV